MTVRVIRGDTRGWRVYRFPPRHRGVASDGADAPGSDPAALQRALSEGYQEGLERGFQEGREEGLEVGRSEGYQRGLEEGLAKGTEDGRLQGRRVFEQACAPLDGMMESFRAAVGEYERGRREQLLEMVAKVAKQVIRVELTLNPAQLLTLAEEVLHTLPGNQEDVQIHLNPEECARIRDIDPERARRWKLVPDERLAHGECRVVTSEAEADIGCQQRLDACMETLGEHLKVEE
ncbi:MAG TPA: flagellar assembly protein FliH [Pseudomonas sp.]|nr:flagellar assembly protein FliH [Pseudomonas sp.]